MISSENHSTTNSKSAETSDNSVITQENESRDFKKKRKKKTGKILNQAEVDINESNNCDNTLNDIEQVKKENSSLLGVLNEKRKSRYI